MTDAAIYEPGEKTHRDENFPVASYVIRKQYRGPILAFYRFARAADDVADHPNFTEQEKITRLEQFAATVRGESDAVPQATALREVLADRKLSPRHPLDLLIAFKQDASKSRYKDWDDLMYYCRYSASPVGRFVLDVHGESEAAWPASDALCSALQVINHLQDCRADYVRLKRVYIPEEILARHGITVEALSAVKASPALRACLTELAQQTQLLLAPKALSPHVKDSRLRLEVRIIERVAHRLLNLLATRDPLSERVHLTKLQFISVAAGALFAGFKGAA